MDYHRTAYHCILVFFRRLRPLARFLERLGKWNRV